MITEEEPKLEGTENGEEQQNEENKQEEQKEPEQKPLKPATSTTLSKIHLTPLSRQDFNMDIIKNWSRIVIQNPPKRRSYHSSFMYKDTYLYIIGGVDITERKQNDIYRVDLSLANPVWEKVEITEGELKPIAYHGGALLDDIYYIIGGQNQEIRPINLIQQYDVANNVILPPFEPDKETFPPVDSHTVNIVENKIYVYGGIGEEGFNRDVYLITIEKPNQQQGEGFGDEVAPKEGENTGENAGEAAEGEEQGENDEKDSRKFEEEGDEREAEANKVVEKKEEEKKEEENKIQFNITNLTSGIADDSMPTPRKGHCSIIKGDSLFIYGGTGLEGKEFGDMWEYSLSGNTFTKIEVNEEDPSSFPKPRSGARFFMHNDDIFLFGGRLALIKESNELWKFDSSKKFTLIHDTLIEQFTEEELKRNKDKLGDKEKAKKDFRLLSRVEVEQRTNPLPYAMKNSKANSKKGKKDKKDKAEQENELNSSFTDEKTPTSKELLARPNVSKMKKSLIYTSKNEELQQAFKNLSEDEKAMIDKNVIQIIAEVPEPRDGMTLDVLRGERVVLFGGDRFKFPFNDIFLFDMNITCTYTPPPKENEGKEEKKEEGEEEQNAEENQE